MDSYPLVSWREIQGNKYSRSLHPAMLTKQGFPITTNAKIIGTSRLNSQYVTINYNRNYVIKWLQVKVIKPLSNCGIDGVGNLLKEAWDKSGIDLQAFHIIADIEDLKM